jgi:predicted transcriptional regulator
MADEQTTPNEVSPHLLATLDVVSAYASHNQTTPDAIIGFVAKLHSQLLTCDGVSASVSVEAPATASAPAQAAVEEVAPEREKPQAAKPAETAAPSNSNAASPSRAAAKTTASRDAAKSEPRDVPAKSSKPVPHGDLTAKNSVTKDLIFCLEDGKGMKSLKRHLKEKYNMTPAEYRKKWNLAPDYPMVAPSYSLARSELAKKQGLGANRRAAGSKAKGERAAA